jgi:hypothetical protein
MRLAVSRWLRMAAGRVPPDRSAASLQLQKVRTTIFTD